MNKVKINEKFRYNVQHIGKHFFTVRYQQVEVADAL